MKEYCIQSKYNNRNVEFVIIIYCQHILSFTILFFFSSLSLSLFHVPYPSLYDYRVEGNV